MYPNYELQAYDHVQGKWIRVAGYTASNAPHYYDHCREGFERYVRGAKDGSPNQKPIGYRITVAGNTVVDIWTNGKV